MTISPALIHRPDTCTMAFGNPFRRVTAAGYNFDTWENHGMSDDRFPSRESPFDGVRRYSLRQAAIGAPTEFSLQIGGCTENAAFAFVQDILRVRTENDGVALHFFVQAADCQVNHCSALPDNSTPSSVSKSLPCRSTSGE